MPQFEYRYLCEGEHCVGQHRSLQWAIAAAMNHLRQGHAKPVGIWSPIGERIYSGEELRKMYPGRLRREHPQQRVKELIEEYMEESEGVG